MKVTIYQINQNKDSKKVKFMNLEMTRKLSGSKDIDLSIYDEVFTGEVPCKNLDDVYYLFNNDHPEGFKGHSLSVSDIVKTEDGYFFCDNFDWVPVNLKSTTLKGVAVSIQKALKEGFILTEVGLGNYADREKFWRSQGKMVVSWYVGTEDGQRTFELYTREKKIRGIKKSEDNLVPMPGSEKLAELKEEYPDYSAMTVKELREICKEKSIKGYSKLSKNDIIEELKKVG